LVLDQFLHLHLSWFKRALLKLDLGILRSDVPQQAIRHLLLIDSKDQHEVVLGSCLVKLNQFVDYLVKVPNLLLRYWDVLYPAGWGGNLLNHIIRIVEIHQEPPLNNNILLLLQILGNNGLNQVSVIELEILCLVTEHLAGEGLLDVVHLSSVLIDEGLYSSFF